MPRRPRLPCPEFGKPSETSDVCVCAAMRILSRAMTEPHVRALAGFGLSLTEFHVLVALQSLPEIHAWHLAAMIRLDPAAVSRSLARLGGAVRGAVLGTPTGCVAAHRRRSTDDDAALRRLGRHRRPNSSGSRSRVCRSTPPGGARAPVATPDSGTRLERRLRSFHPLARDLRNSERVRTPMPVAPFP